MTQPPIFDWSTLDLDDLIQGIALERTGEMPNRSTSCLFAALKDLGWDGNLLEITAQPQGDRGRYYYCSFLQWKDKTMNGLGESVAEFFDGRWGKAGNIIPDEVFHKQYSAEDMPGGQYLHSLTNDDSLIDEMRVRAGALLITQNTSLVSQTEVARPRRRM